MNIINENKEKSKRYLPHEVKTRENAVKTYRNGNSIEYVCRKYHISRMSLYRWNKKYDGTKESITDKSHKPLSKHPSAHTDEELKWINDLIVRHKNNNLTLCEFWYKLRINKGYSRHIGSLYRVIVNGKIKCRKSVKINVGFPTFLISVTITIEVIVNMSMENGNKLRNMLKEMIRLNIKPNFAALGREYGCDYRTAKVKYYEEQNKEKGIEIAKKERKYIIDDYKELIINKLETIPGITAYSIYYFLKVEKGYNGSYETIKNFVRSNKDKRKQPASIRVEPIIGKSAQVDWKEDFKLTNKDGELFVINLFLIRLHYSKKFYAILTIDKKRDEVKKCIVESLEYFGGTPREIWFDNMATVMVKEGKHKKVHNEIKQLGNDIGFQPILCQARRPKSKGTVENLAKLCDRLKSYNNEFETLDDLINIVNKFNEECGNEKSQAHNKIVNEVFEDEKKYLIPLPNKNILEKYKQNIEYRKVSQDSMIVYRGNRYSVPTRFIGSYLGIRIINNQVYIYDNTDLVRCHVITNNNLNYHNEDKIEILKSDLLYGLDDKEIENKINNTDLQIYDFLKGMN